jgi:carboxypeptidase C (cathepsin A)
VCLDSVKGPGRAQRNALLSNILGDRQPDLYKAILGSNNYEPCAEDYTTEYLNLAAVKEAIHVKTDIKWNMCSYTTKYDQKDGHNSMVPIYSYLIDGNYDLDILVFSGDDDAVCGTVGVQHWIWDLGYKVTGRMYQSYEIAGQMAGYATKWADSKLAFVTVHGAGHEVPAYKPEVALVLWKKYLNGEWTN